MQYAMRVERSSRDRVGLEDYTRAAERSSVNGRNRVVSVWACACMLFAAAELAADEQWRGFRGLESQARSDAPIRALDWTAQGARQWMTPIPGDGVSSPVPTADRIYFTTSWQSAASDRMRRMLAVALLLFAGGAAIAGMTWNNQAVRASIAVGALAVVGLCVLLWWPEPETSFELLNALSSSAQRR